MWEILLPTLSVIFLGMEGVIASFCMLMVLCSKFLLPYFSHFMQYHSVFIYFDKMSVFLCMLTFWMGFMMTLSMVEKEKQDYLNFQFNMLSVMLVFCFCVYDFLAFYIFFELSLIPTLMIILGWGVQPERLQAGGYLMMYTLAGSMPLLVSILHFYYLSGTTNFIWLMSSGRHEIYDILSSEYGLLCLMWILAFIMKLPVYGTHLWLPKAHVEAPVAGSMVLAGVLLKLGAYGILRVFCLIDMSSCFWSNFFFFWFLVSTVMVGFICFRQSDMKALVAYSSIAHMSLVLCGLFSVDYIGISGALGMMVAHGICSSGLFFGVQCFYESSGSRSVLLNRGFMNLSPLFCYSWLMLCVLNASAPPSFNLLSEFYIMASIMHISKASSMFLMLSVFLCGLFSIYLYTITSHGKWSSLKNFWMGISPRQGLVLIFHFLPLFFMTFLSNSILMCF